MRRELVWGTMLSVAAHWVAFRVPWPLPSAARVLPRPTQEIEISLPLPSSLKGSEKTDSAALAYNFEPETPESPRVSPAPVTQTPPPRKVSKTPRPAIQKHRMNEGTAKPKASAEQIGRPSEHLAQALPGSQDGLGMNQELPQGEAAMNPIADGGSEAKGGPRGGVAPVARSELQKALPRYGVNPKPPYPEAARRRGYEGTVVLSVRVLKDGSAGYVRIAQSSGYSLLDQSALETVASWKFLPARLGDEPLEMEVQVPVRFQLEP